MKTNNPYDLAISCLQDAGLVHLADQFRRLDDSSSSSVRIAVIGEFKTGKSTLLNRMILEDGTLFTDFLEATAIPTEITFGAHKTLEVYRYKKEHIQVGGQGSPSSFMEIDSKVVEPMIIPDPSPETIRKYTAGESVETKADLLRSTGRVRLLFPNPKLKDLTFIDTPGIDSTLGEVINSIVLGVLPSADLIILVKQAKQLSRKELDLLRSSQFSQSSARGLILINDDPKHSNLDEKDRIDLERAIESQLRNIDRHHLPVWWANLSYPKGKVQPAPAPLQVPDSKKTFAEVLKGRVLGQSTETVAKTHPGDCNTLFERTMAYLDANAESGKSARLREHFGMLIGQVIEAIRFEIKNLDLGELEKQKLKSEIESKELVFREKYESLTRAFHASLEKLQKDFVHQLRTKLDTLNENYTNSMKEANTIEAVIEKIQQIERNSQFEIEAIISKRWEILKEGIEAEQKKYEASFSNAFDFSKENSNQVDRLYGGFLTKIPSLVYTVADILISIKLGPLGVIGDLIGRFIVLKHIPFLKNFSPSGLMKEVIVMQTKDSFRKGIDQITSSFEGDLKLKCNQIFEEQQNGFDQYWSNHKSALLESMNHHSGGDARRIQLNTCILTLQSLS
jgi:GTPase Era involved in 16S rRNA processing